MAIERVASRPGEPGDPYAPAALFDTSGPVRLRAELHQDAVFTVDEALVVHGVNDATERLYGVVGGEVVGRGVEELVHPEARDRFASYLRRLLRGETVLPFEAFHVRPDGTEIHVLVSASPLVDQDDRIVGAAVFSRDVDVFVRARQELVRKHDQLATATGAGGVGTWAIDLSTDLLTGSPEFYRMNRYRPDCPPLPWGMIIAALDVDTRLRLERFRFSDDVEISFEYRVGRDPADARVIMAAGRKIPDSHGGAGHIVGVTWDVTDERAAQRSIAEAQLRFQRVFYGSVSPMAVVDRMTRTIMANDAHCELCGYTRDEIIGHGYELITHPEDVEVSRRIVQGISDGRTPARPYRRRLVRKDGSLRWVETTLSLLRRPSGFDDGECLVQFRDITEEYEATVHLQYVADHDPLTDLLNRGAFERVLGAHADGLRLGRRRVSGALLLLDLDHLKHHNDTRGHAAGDAVLIATASALRDRVRETDHIGRLGGDEFAVLLPDVTIEEAEIVAADLVALVRDRAGLASPDEERPITVSIGLTDFADRPEQAVLLARADAALYRAKESGRDGWAVSVAPGP